MVVEIQPEDIINDKRLTVNNEAEETFPELAVLHFQEELERQCWLQGGRRQTAPAQRMVDFTRKKLSYDLPESSYSPGLISSPCISGCRNSLPDDCHKASNSSGAAATVS